MSDSESEFLRRVVEAVTGLPLHQHLGLELVDASRPELGLTMPVDEHAVNPSRVLHGGLVPLLLDVTSFLALLPSLDASRSAVTVSSTCSLMSAVPLGAVVRAEASVERLGRTTAFTTARLHHGDRVVATGQVVKAVVASPAGS